MWQWFSVLVKEKVKIVALDLSKVIYYLGLLNIYYLLKTLWCTNGPIVHLLYRQCSEILLEVMLKALCILIGAVGINQHLI